MNRLWLSQQANTAWNSGAATPRQIWKFTNYRDILRPYEVGV